MSSSDFCFRYFHFPEVESTNIHARELISAKKARQGDVVSCDFQTKGRGQQGKGWVSEWGKNLLFSQVVFPSIKVEDQVYLNMAVSNSLRATLDSLSVKNVSIKWPNDVLVGRKKIAGILIENSLSANVIKYSIVGIGLNVNQVEFPDFDRQATSLINELGYTLDVKVILELILSHLEEAYLKLKKGLFQEIKAAYLDHLYGYDSTLRFKDEKGHFKAKISGIDSHGRLLLKRGSDEKAYALKELTFIN